jgi:hypothetical protein
MRVLLLLTFGFPVLAAQVAALAGPRAEPVICTSAPRGAAEASTDGQAPKALATLRLQVAVAVPVLPVVERAEAVSCADPEGSSARALTFVQHHRRQAT